MKKEMIQKLAGFVVVLFTLCLSVGGTMTYKTQLKRANKVYEGICIVLDAGHGGKDAGAQFEGLNEREINLEIVQKLKVQLEKEGFEVLLTRKDANDLSDENASTRKSSDMKHRMEIINQKKVDLYISVHMNAYINNEVQGIQIFYKKGSEDSKYFANFIQDELEGLNKVLPLKSGDYYILNKTDKIGILLECGFLSNPQDRTLFMSDAYKNRFVKKVKNGILHFIQDVYE